MPFLPVVDRELRVVARRRSSYWLRLVAAVAAFLVCLWLSLFPPAGLPPTALGKSVFVSLTVVAFAYCLLVGPFITADCISSEKREGSLGLLFLTDLRALDIVLGKWVATSLAGFYGLISILPALALPLSLGGVTPGEYGRVALAVVNAVFFSLTAGIFVSSLSRDQSKAILASVVVVLGLSGLLPGLMALFSQGFLGRGLANHPVAAVASPIYTAQFAMDASYRAAPRVFWLSLGVVHGLSWMFLLGTALVVPRVWRKEPEEPGARRRWWLRLGRTRRWQARLRRRLEKNPVYAVASRHRWPHWMFWSLVGIVAINIYWMTVGYRTNPNSYAFHQNFSLALVFLNRVWLAAMACRFYSEARRTGAWELLLTTPLSPRTIVRGRRRALVRLFFWPVVVIALLHLVYVWGVWGPYARQGTSALILRAQGIMAAGSMISFLTDVLAISAVGAWFSLAASRTRLAVLQTFAVVILVPWILIYALEGSRTLLQWFPTQYYLARPALTVTKNLAFVVWATWRLRRHFRNAASGQFKVRPVVEEGG